MAALSEVFLICHHVVTEVVKAELVVCTVGDVAVVSRLLFSLCLIVDNETCGEAEELVDTSHFLLTHFCKVLVNGNDVNALACKGVEVRGENCNESFTLTCLHFCDSSLMEKDTAHELNSEGALAENSVCRLSDNRKGVGKDIVKSLSCAELIFEEGSHFLQLAVAHCLVFIPEGFDLVHYGGDLFYLLIAVCAENFGN